MGEPAARGRSSRAAVGAARVLALAYGFFVLAAGARSGVQIATKFSAAPLAYVLSAAAACMYTAGLVVFVLAERDPARRRWALWLGAAEFSGVLAVGLASELARAAFPDATVWSGFGAGYGYVPAVLPVLAICWARFSPDKKPSPDKNKPREQAEEAMRRQPNAQ